MLNPFDKFDSVRIPRVGMFHEPLFRLPVGKGEHLRKSAGKGLRGPKISEIDRHGEFPEGERCK